MTEPTDERLLSMAAKALGYASIDPERGAEEGPGSFRQALEVFPEELIAFARAVLAAEPPAPAPAADGEREKLAQWLEDEAVYYEGLSTEASAKATRAAALLREARLQSVPVVDRPWERPGWCDAEGRCWWGRCADDFFSPEWTMATLASIEEFCSDSMPQHCLPHWAIPVPANPTETTTTGNQ